MNNTPRPSSREGYWNSTLSALSVLAATQARRHHRAFVALRPRDRTRKPMETGCRSVRDIDPRSASRSRRDDADPGDTIRIELFAKTLPRTRGCPTVSLAVRDPSSVGRGVEKRLVSKLLIAAS